MSNLKHNATIWDLIRKIKVGMLITRDLDQNILRSRPMHLIQESYNGKLYFYTSITDAKALEITENREVCVTFSDPKHHIYVSLSGYAKINTDQDLIDKYWNMWVAAWFEDGPDDPRVAFVEVEVDKGEFWKNSQTKQIRVEEVMKSSITGLPPNLGENEKFG